MNLLSGPTRGGRLFSFGLVLVLVASWSVPVPEPAPETTDLALNLLADPPEIDWRLLAGLDYRTGEKTEDLEAVDGTVVKIAGFAVPLEDWVTSATEFLLVPYAGACIHTPPPPPHQLVYVKMDGSRRASLTAMAPVWVEGVLHVDMEDSVYGQAGFRLVGLKVYPYQS